MTPQLTIGLDFDDTFTADPDFWIKFIELARSFGHVVICVSGRRETFDNRRKLESALPDGVKVLLSYDQPKADYARENGYIVDIWIDDKPGMI